MSLSGAKPLHPLLDPGEPRPANLDLGIDPSNSSLADFLRVLSWLALQQLCVGWVPPPPGSFALLCLEDRWPQALQNL